MKRTFLALLLLMFPGAGFGGVGPDVAPEALQRALSNIGFVAGAERTVEGVRIRLDDVRVGSQGKWLVIKLLPKRL